MNGVIQGCFSGGAGSKGEGWFSEVSLTMFDGRCTMARLAMVFFIIGVIAAAFGLSFLSVGAAGIAAVLLFVFLLRLIISLVFRLVRSSGAPDFVKSFADFEAPVR